MRKRSTFLAACAFLVFTTTSQAQTHQALRLNGKNYITTSPNIVDGSSPYTIEFWAYIDDSAMDSQPHQFVSDGGTDGTTAFYIGYDASGNILIGDYWNGYGNNTGIKMPVKQWTNIAVVYDNNASMAYLYLNGVLKTANVSFSAPGPNFLIGVQTDLLSQFAEGKIDEFRAWHAMRSAYTIKRDLFTDPDPTDPDLITWYKMDSTNSHTVLNESQNSTINVSDFDGTIQGDGTRPDTPAVHSWGYSPIQTSSNGLTFNGTEKDQVIIPDSSAYDQMFTSTGSKPGTIELWVNPISLSSSWTTLVSKYGQFSILLSSTQIGLDDGSGTIHTLDLPTDGDFISGFPSGPDVWSHLAFEYDGNSTTKVYYNGFLLDNYIITGTLGGASPGQPLTIGITKDSSSGSSVDSRPFTGGIDEVRLWSVQQSDADVFNNMNNTLSGTEANLVSQFSFDQGVPNQDNTGMSVAFDNVASNNGLLANFQLTGTSSNFNLHTLNTVVAPLPVTLTKFTAQRSGMEGVLQWQTAQEENSKDFTIERSTDGKTYTSIGVVAAAGKSSQPIDYSFTDLTPMQSLNYYRLRQSDMDSKYTYSPVRTLNFSPNSQLSWYKTGSLTAQVVYLQGTNETYAITDISGRILRQGQLSNGKTSVSGLPRGVYIVTIITRLGTTLTTKLLLF